MKPQVLILGADAAGLELVRALANDIGCSVRVFHSVRDEAPATLEAQKAAFYTRESLSEHMHFTPEGFLVCEEVPLARIGEQIYGPDEVPDDITPGPEGYIVVVRTPEEVFRPEFLQSLEGKPVVIGHPMEFGERIDITPENIKRYEVGHVVNPRRGSGELSDFLVSELMIKEPQAIQAVVDKVLREVSIGYVAIYNELPPAGSGRAEQTNMIANHLALVRQARCGPMCAIRDEQHQGAEPMIPARVRDEAAPRPVRLRRWFDGVCAAALAMVKTDEERAKLQAELTRARDEMPEDDKEGGGDTHVHVGGDTRDEEAHTRINALEEKFAAHDEMLTGLKAHTGYGAEETGDDAELEGALKEEAPAGTGDKAMKAGDSEYLAEAHQETVAGAEILVPGIKVTKYERAAKPKKTLDDITGLRKEALRAVLAEPNGKTYLEGLNGGKAVVLDSMPVGDVRKMFQSAVATKKTINAAAAARDTQRTEQRQDAPKAVRTAKDLNDLYAARYGAAAK